MTDRRRLTPVVAAAVLAVAVVAPVWATERAGTVSALTGRATATADADERELSARDPVHLRELVSTAEDARATLGLGEHTVLHLGGAVEILLERYVVDAGGTFELMGGAVVLEHDGPPMTEPLTIDSQYGRIVVRGTTVFAGPSRGVFGVFVQDGVAEVTAGGRTVVLEAGEGTNIESPGEAPSEPQPWGTGRIEEALASVL
ncbi:FecR domain-containing protein [Acuticoccus sp.]|uniref:FecR domain-containing protein n=1 Tax=Acuticoccus sp. TaxID=1904378 RepID=UPI003B52C148